MTHRRREPHSAVMRSGNSRGVVDGQNSRSGAMRFLDWMLGVQMTRRAVYMRVNEQRKHLHNTADGQNSHSGAMRFLDWMLGVQMTRRAVYMRVNEQRKHLHNTADGQKSHGATV